MYTKYFFKYRDHHRKLKEGSVVATGIRDAMDKARMRRMRVIGTPIPFAQ